MADDIRKETEKLSREIDDASKELKEGFQKIIGGLRETNAPLAKTVASLREQSKNTFAGALGSAKLKNVASQIDQFLSEGLDDVAFEKLQKEFGDIDLTEFKRVSESAKSLEDGIKALEDARDERIANSKVLREKDAEIEQRRLDSLKLRGAALNAHMKKTEELEKSREESYKSIASNYDKQIETQKKLLEEESSLRNDYNERLNKGLKDTTSFEGLESFSDGLKELTGFDLVGGLNTVTEKFMAFKQVLGGLGQAFMAIGASLRRAVIAVTAAAKSMLVASLPFVGIGILVGTAVAALVLGAQFIVKKFQENKEVIFQKMGDFATIISEKVQSIKDFFVGSFIKAREGVGDFGSSLNDMFASFSDFVRGVILSVKERLAKLGIGDSDEIAAERAQLEENKKQRELAAQERARQAEERSNLSAVELGRIERNRQEQVQIESAEQPSRPSLEPVENSVVQPMQRALGRQLTSEDVENMSTEEQIRLGFARVETFNEGGVDENGRRREATATGVSGGQFQTSARGMTAENLMSAQEEQSSSRIKRAREETDALKEKVANNIVSQTSMTSNNMNNVSNSFRMSRPTTGDRDATVGKLNSVF